jgi:FkbM family methyltransferase
VAHLVPDQFLPHRFRVGRIVREREACIGDVRVPIDRRIMSQTIIDAIATGQYEPNEARLMAQIIEPKDIVLELGGGIGVTSTIAARLARQGQVTVIEANPDLLPIIETTHRMNGVTAKVMNGVVIERPDSDRLPFYKSADLWAGSLDASLPDSIGSVDVPVIALDRILATVSPTVLAFDIEGGEDPLFVTAQLPGVRKILGEFHPQKLGDARIGDIIRNFFDQGFELDTLLCQRGVCVFRRTER